MLKNDRDWAIKLTASILVGSINQREIENSKYDLEAIVDEAFACSLPLGDYYMCVTNDRLMEIARNHRRA